MKKNVAAVFVMTAVVCICFAVIIVNVYCEDSIEQAEQQQLEYHRARVLNVIKHEDTRTEYSGGVLVSNIQLVDALILKGQHKGEVVRAEYVLNYGFSEKYKSIQLSKGDEVLLFLEEDDRGKVQKAYVAEIARDRFILYLVAGFLILLIAVGRLKGVKAVISLALTAAAVFFVLLPAILDGWDPVIVSVGVCVAVICITLIIIGGFNRKTFSAVAGTTGGVVAAGVIALIIGSLAKLTGFGDNESQMLMYIPREIHFDFRGLLFAGIIIGAMGATMDVGMTIASAMHEIKANSPDIKTAALIRAGMNVGRDAMATMANTLILAYAGGSLHLMLLLFAYRTPFSHVINWDMIASEVLRAIAGSIGIVFTIPITAFAAALVEEYRKMEYNF